MGLWGGVIGATIGCTAWIIAFTAMKADWVPLLLTLAIDVVVVIVAGRLVLRHPRNMVLIMAGVVALLCAHSVGVFWLRYDMWRAGVTLTPEQIFTEKRTVAFTVTSAVALLFMQFALIHWLQARGRKRRAKARS